MGEVVELHPTPTRHTVTILSRRRWYRADVSVERTRRSEQGVASARRPIGQSRREWEDKRDNSGILVEIMRRMGTGHSKNPEDLIGPAPYKILSRGAVDDYPYHVVLDRAQELVNNLEYHEFHGSKLDG